MFRTINAKSYPRLVACVALIPSKIPYVFGHSGNINNLGKWSAGEMYNINNAKWAILKPYPNLM